MNVNRHLKYEMQMWENAKQRNSTNNNVKSIKEKRYLTSKNKLFLVTLRT